MRFLTELTPFALFMLLFQISDTVSISLKGACHTEGGTSIRTRAAPEWPIRWTP
jgi:hypothetical protein